MMAKTWKFCLAYVVVATIETTAKADSFVLATGSNKSLDPRAKTLDFAATDAFNFGEAMNNVGGVAKDRVQVIGNPSIRDFESSLTALTKKMASRLDRDANKFIFFFSGHADERGLHFRDGYFSKEALDLFLSQLQAKTKVLIIDSCFGGKISSKGVKPVKGFGAPKMSFDEPSGSIYLTASGSNEFAFESRKIGGGLFTSHIVAGLMGKADGNNDGVVTATELYEYAFRATQLNSRLLPVPNVQNPEFVSDLKGRGAVALSYPSTIRGQVLLSSKIRGSIKLYASKGIGTFEHVKGSIDDETISIPAGDYSLDIDDGVRKGSSTLKVAAKSTSLLTENDVEWHKAPEISGEIKSRGADLPQVTHTRLLSGALGTLDFKKVVELSVAYAKIDENSRQWPRIELAAAESVTQRKRKNGDTVPGGDRMPQDEAPSTNDVVELRSTENLSLGYGIPVYKNLQASQSVYLIPAMAWRTANYDFNGGDRSALMLSLKADLALYLDHSAVSLHAGYEKSFWSTGPKNLGPDYIFTDVKVGVSRDFN